MARHRSRIAARRWATVVTGAVAAGAVATVAPGVAAAEPGGPGGLPALPGLGSGEELPGLGSGDELPGQPALDALGLSETLPETPFEKPLEIPLPPLPLPVPLPELPLLDLGGDGRVVGTPRGADVPAAVPAPYRAIVANAARTCPEVTASLIAAQIAVESTWNPAARSGAGAQGLAQFIPSTWAAYGVDGNGDGHRNPFDPADAIAAQAAHMCQLVGVVRLHAIPGDAVDNALAAYNAGVGAVLTYQGVPPYRETQAYVTKVRTLAASYDSAPRAD